MSQQTWNETLITAQVAGNNLTSSNTATSILPAAAKITLPTNYFTIGKMLRVQCWGQLGNIVTTPGTLTMDVRFGSIVVFNGGAMQLSTTAHTALPFYMDVTLTCRAIGNSTNANLMGQGLFTSQCVNISTSDSTATHSTLLIPNTSPAVGTGFDSTVTIQVDVFATFSLSNANAIQLQQFALTSLN